MADINEDTPLLRRFSIPTVFTQPGCFEQMSDKTNFEEEYNTPACTFPFSKMQTKQEDSSQPRMPQAIAHRGYKAKFPENTLAAFAGAIAIGAHAVETDVHITKDGVVVLSHDNTLNRCFGRPEKIIDCDWSFIAPLLTTEEPKQHMPRLTDLLAFLATEKRKDVWVLLDIKLDNNPEDIIRLIASTIAASPCLPSSPWSSRIVLGCWAAKYVPLCAEYLPGFPCTHIGFSLSYAKQFLHIPNVGFNMLLPMLMAPGGKKFLASARKAQKPVLAWTVNETRKMKWCIRRQLDGVITDDPKHFLDVCRNYDAREKEQGLSFKTWVDVIRIWVLATIFGFLYRNRFAGRTKSQVQVV
ncbi:PLC-like phosphodiesterase [Aureobasidium sp. EXF-12298]|nr:PLC-like phosphodiesterase [Aureobasidium sp. EXF-12298]